VRPRCARASGGGAGGAAVTLVSPRSQAHSPLPSNSPAVVIYNGVRSCRRHRSALWGAIGTPARAPGRRSSNSRATLLLRGRPERRRGCEPPRPVQSPAATRTPLHLARPRQQQPPQRRPAHRWLVPAEVPSTGQHWAGSGGGGREAGGRRMQPPLRSRGRSGARREPSARAAGATCRAGCPSRARRCCWRRCRASSEAPPVPEAPVVVRSEQRGRRRRPRPGPSFAAAAAAAVAAAGRVCGTRTRRRAGPCAPVPRAPASSSASAAPPPPPATEKAPPPFLPPPPLAAWCA